VAYNRRNILQRIIDVQDITIEYTANGVSQEYVFQKVIEPNYRISRRTYYNYLGTNAKKELRSLEQYKAAQMALF